MDQDSDLELRCSDLLFGVRRSIRYHVRRRRFFDSWARFSTILSLVAGSATLAALLASWCELATKFFALAVTVTAALNVVLRFSERARDHHDLVRRFTDLEKRILLWTPCTEDQYRQIQGERLDIEADEEPVKKVVDLLSHNELCTALGYGELYQVGFLQRILANYFDLGAHSIRKSAPQ